MNIKPHKRYLDDGSNSVRVGQQVAQSDANLAYYSSQALNPSENITVKQMHKRVNKSVFDRSNESSDHFVRPSNPSPGLIGGDPNLDNPLKIGDSFPMWSDQNGILNFARERVIRYNDGSRPIYDLLNPIVGGNFVLTNIFSEFEKTNPIYYRYVARNLVFDNRASFSGKVGMAIDVTDSCLLKVLDYQGKDLDKNLYRVFYEKLAKNIYKATIFAQPPDELTIEYSAAIKKSGGYEPSGKRNKERYIHHPVMKRVDLSPIAKNEYQILGVGETNRRIKIPFSAREIPDKSLPIRWRIQKTKSDRTLTTTWHYDTVGSTLKNVSHDTIKTVFSKFFPEEATSGLQAIVETIPAGRPITTSTSGDVLRVRSNGSHEDIFPKLPYTPPTSGSASVSWTAKATAKYNLIPAANQNHWGVWQNNTLISSIDESFAELPLSGSVPKMNSPSEGFKANEDTKWLRFTGENIRDTIFRTHLYVPRYCSIHLGVDTLKDDNVENYIRICRSHRESVDSDYRSTEVFLDKRDTNSADGYISLSPGWNNIWIETHTPNMILFETIEVQMNRIFQPWEWQMSSRINSSYSSWNQARIDTVSVPYGKKLQVVPESFKNEIESNRLCEFQWISVTPSQGSNYAIEPMDSFKETGAFEIVGIDPNSNSSCSEDIIALPRLCKIKAQPMQYIPFEDVTVTIQGKEQQFGGLPPPPSRHSDLNNRNIRGDGLWRDNTRVLNFWIVAWETNEPMKYPVRDYSKGANDEVLFRGRNYASTTLVGKHTKSITFETNVWVNKDISVPWNWQVEGNWWDTAEALFHVNGSQAAKLKHKESGYQGLTLNLKQGWNTLRVRTSGGPPGNFLWIWNFIDLEFDRPLWKALLDAGLEIDEFIIDSEGGINVPIIDSTISAEVSGRVYFDPRIDFVAELNTDIFDGLLEEDSLGVEFSRIELSDDKKGRVVLHIDEQRKDYVKLRVEQISAEIRPISNAITEEVRLEPHPYEDSWHYAYQNGQQGEIKVGHLANLAGIKNIAISDPDLANNAFLMISPEKTTDLINIKVEDDAKMYIWNKRASFDPCIAVFMSDIKSKGSLLNIQLATHLHKLGCSKRHSLMYGNFVGEDIDNEFGRVIVDIDNNSGESNLTTDEEEQRRLMEMNWYISIDAIGNHTVRIPNLESLIGTNPIDVHPIFRFYSNLLPFKDYELNLHYSMPEYHYQNLDSSDQDEIKRRIVHKEYPIVLDSRRLKVKNRNLWVPNDVGVTWEGYVNVENHEIDYVDMQKGIIHLKTRLSDSERPTVRYYYKDNRLEYRGSTIQNEFLHLDLNPGINHSFTQVGNFIPGHLLPDTVVTEETPGPYLLNKSILLYLRPTIITVGEQVLYEGTHGVYHTDLSPEELREYDPLALPIAIINVVPNSSPKDIVLIDTRSRGGGLLEEIEADIIEQIDPEAESYWDIGNYDGQAYQGNAVAYIRLPGDILKKNGGSFDKSDIEEVVHRHIALGVLPIIEYVDRSLLVNLHEDIVPDPSTNLDQEIRVPRAFAYGNALSPIPYVGESASIDSIPTARVTALALPVIRENAVIEIPVARANARALVAELEVEKDQFIDWELPFQLDSMQANIFLKDIPGYNAATHHFTDDEFYGTVGDDWDSWGEEVYVEVVFLGNVGDDYEDPHPIYFPGWMEYEWGPPHSQDGKICYDPSGDELFYKHGALGTRFYKLVRYSQPVYRRHYEP